MHPPGKVAKIDRFWGYTEKSIWLYHSIRNSKYIDNQQVPPCLHYVEREKKMVLNPETPRGALVAFPSSFGVFVMYTKIALDWEKQRSRWIQPNNVVGTELVML